MADGNASPSKVDGTRYQALDLVRGVDNRTRDALMRAGSPPAFENLVGWEFAGHNTNAITDLLRIRKFKKGFYAGPPRSPEGPEPYIQGYNVPVVHNGIGAPHVAQPSDAAPRRFGFYRVHRVVPGARDSKYPNALFLDYGLGANGLSLPPSFWLRDYIVQVYPDDPTLLLGRAYVALLGLRIDGGFFVLQRMNRHEFAG